ncbi:MAG: hypothetical protein OSJ61_20350 [Lachnospiraceae bacterium]|nr:hypothetical protein [Lachnospiraceae bacterium]
MDTETRSNQGYEIIEGCSIESKEIVIGYHRTAPNPYVCWYCKGSDNYYQGWYCSTLAAARGKLIERYRSECEMPYKSITKSRHTEDNYGKGKLHYG